MTALQAFAQLQPTAGSSTSATGSLVAPASLVVADSSELDMPCLGRVMAEDKTCEPLGTEIKAALERDDCSTHPTK